MGTKFKDEPETNPITMSFIEKLEALDESATVPLNNLYMILGDKQLKLLRSCLNTCMMQSSGIDWNNFNSRDIPYLSLNDKIRIMNVIEDILLESRRNGNKEAEG